MADINYSSLVGTPKGTTSNRPSNPSLGDTYYNGTLGCLEIYSSNGWIPANLIASVTNTVDNVRYGTASSTSIDGGQVDGIIDARVSESLDNIISLTFNGGTV